MKNKGKSLEKDKPLVNASQTLRQIAEEMSLKNDKLSAENLDALSAEETKRLIHELRVHQIELEIQNEELRRTHAELDTVREHYFDLYDMAPVGYCTVSEKGIILKANLTSASLLGVMRRTMINKPFSKFILTDDNDIYYLHRKELFKTGKPQVFELRMLRLNGLPFWTRIISTALQDSAGEPICRITLSDISKQKEAQEISLQWANIFTNVEFAVATANIEGTKFELMNPAFAKMHGYTVDELIGKPALEVFAPEVREAITEQFRITNQTGYNIFESVHIRKDGSKFPILSNSTAIKDQSGKLLYRAFTVSDITEQKQKEEELLYNANHDCLTGLCNRRRFEEVLNQIEKSGEVPVSIAVGDVNNLKLINDGYGYSSGDTILKKIAQILKKVGNEHSYLARIGGDEFSLIFPNTSYEEANVKVKQIKLRCAEESVGELMLSITFGVGTKISKDQSLVQCQHLAEERMHTSKLLDSKNIRSAIIENLRMVLEEKTGESRKHCERMAEIARFIGEKLGMQEYEVEKLTLLALLHDIGKTAISDSILLKPGKLDEIQCETMQKHCETGYRIAKTMPELLPIAEGVLHHHERYDGKGYPQGLMGNNIPLISRIIAILDTYDAMTNDRPYRKAVSKTEAIEEIKRCSGTQFDPEIVKVFLNLVV